MHQKGKRAESRKTKKRQKKKVFLNILELFFISLMLFSGFKIYGWIQDNRQNEATMQEIANDIVISDQTDENGEENIAVNFQSLQHKNRDTVAWLKVEGTNIAYPVLQAKDNEYYLNHNFSKKTNGAGWIFADYRNKLDGTDKNIIVYGHSRTSGSMFGTLKNVLNKSWCEQESNRRVLFYTEEEESVYEVFSVYTVELEDYYISTNFSTDQQYQQFLNTITKRSIYNFKTEVTTEDTILTLSTCATNNQYRVVLHAKKIVD